MRAMILAAGYGTRLWPLTIDRAKPAIPFLGRPLVGYVAEYLAQYGCRDVVVNLHHQGESVRRALGRGERFGVQLHYVEEPEILGTSGALDNARPLLGNETFIVINGKIVTDINLNHALETHRRTGAMVTLILRRNVKHERFSMIETQDGFVTGFGGMPSASDNASEFLNSVDALSNEDAPLMFTGIQFMEQEVFSFIPKGVYSHSVTDVFPKIMASGHRIAAHVSDGMWYELSTIQRYLEVSLALLARQGKSIHMDNGSVIHPDATVRESILWENVKIESGAHVRRGVLGDGVQVSGGEKLEDVAVVRAELVCNSEPPPKALKGEVRGSNFVVPLAQ